MIKGKSLFISQRSAELSEGPSEVREKKKKHLAKHTVNQNIPLSHPNILDWVFEDFVMQRVALEVKGSRVMSSKSGIYISFEMAAKCD